jgi:uncharacterized protein YprB with RNaseH-like and TPR domain
MLRNTFLHIPGVGLKTEQNIWSGGILSWDDLLGEGSVHFSPMKRDIINQCLEDSLNQLATGNPKHFAGKIPANQHWRFFPEFRESTAYLDIETTGLDSWNNEITTIALYDGNSLFTYVQGRNLDEFRGDIQRYKVIVTYNGKCFDVPFMESYFRMNIPQVHIDLRYLLRGLGYTGGLKGCEKKAGIDRKELEGIDGYFAVLLWQDYQRTNNEKALETLLAYNIQDVVNLETLMLLSYNLKLKETPFVQSHQLPYPPALPIPFKANLETIERIKAAGDYRPAWRGLNP